MKSKIKSIIVEDEKSNQELLLKLLTEYCPSVEVLAIVASVKEGVESVTELQPDLLFLDIELPDGTGFDLLHELPSRKFNVIFTTGYDTYAIKAIKYAAFDYLLKPLSIEKLQQAIRKYKDESLSGQNFDEKIFVTDNEKYRMIDCMNVLYLESRDNYTFIHLEDNKILTSYSLKKFEETLPDYFFRVHKSYIVNLNHIQSVSRGAGGSVALNDGSSLPVAFRRKSELLELLKALNI